MARTRLRKGGRQKRSFPFTVSGYPDRRSLPALPPRKLTCAPLSSSSSTVMSADVPFSLTVECLPCQKKYTHFSFPTARTCCSPFCLLPTAKQRAHAEESTLAIGLNSTWFNLICQLSTIPSRTGKKKCAIGGTLGLQASGSLCRAGVVSSGGCKPTGRDACVGWRKRCRKTWYYLEKNNWQHLSQFACEMACPVMLPEECIMAHFPHYTLFFGSRRAAAFFFLNNQYFVVMISK